MRILRSNWNKEKNTLHCKCSRKLWKFAHSVVKKWHTLRHTLKCIYTHTHAHTRVEQFLRWCTQIVLYIAHTNTHTYIWIPSCTQNLWTTRAQVELIYAHNSILCLIIISHRLLQLSVSRESGATLAPVDVQCLEFASKWVRNVISTTTTTITIAAAATGTMLESTRSGPAALACMCIPQHWWLAYGIW